MGTGVIALIPWPFSRSLQNKSFAMVLTSAPNWNIQTDFGTVLFYKYPNADCSGRSQTWLITGHDIFITSSEWMIISRLLFIITKNLIRVHARRWMNNARKYYLDSALGSHGQGGLHTISKCWLFGALLNITNRTLNVNHLFELSIIYKNNIWLSAKRYPYQYATKVKKVKTLKIWISTCHKKKI